jgi:hypothetical protein
MPRQKIAGKKVSDAKSTQNTQANLMAKKSAKSSKVGKGSSLKAEKAIKKTAPAEGGMKKK